MAVIRLEAEDEFELIELQGELESDAEVLDGLKLGVLKVLSEKVKCMQAQLTIGRHLLTGKLTPLSKPLAVVERSASALTIKGFARSKWVFSSRPAPLLDSNQKKPKVDLSLHFPGKSSNGK